MGLFTKTNGIHFGNPKEFRPYCHPSANLYLYDSGSVARTAATTAFFTELAARGLQEQTDWTADTYKTLLSISSGSGLVAGMVGPTAGGAATTTFRITVDGVVSTITVTGLASGERALVTSQTTQGVDFTTAEAWIQAGAEALDADKATFGSGGGGSGNVHAFPIWRWSANIPMLKFNLSLLIEAKHSASITNSTATAYSGVMYRKFLEA